MSVIRAMHETGLGGEAAVPVRDLFPGCRSHVYLDTAARSPLNVLAKHATDRFLDGAFAGGDKKKMFETVERVRGLFAALINADAAEIAVTKNVSEGLNVVAHSIEWARGDNVVLCPAIEHPNNVYAWYHAARLYGLEIRVVEAPDFVVRAGEIAKLIDRRTRVCALSAQSFVPGYLTDLAEISRLCATHGVALVVDAAQAAGVQHIDMKAMPIAAMAVSTQKGLLGFYGMGFLYVRRDLADALMPRYLARFGVAIDGAHEADLGALENIRFAEGALRFDLGNYNFLAAAAVEPGLALLNRIGTEAIGRHTGALAVRLSRGLHELGLPVMGWPDGSRLGSIVTVGKPDPAPAERERVARLGAHLKDNAVKFSERRDYLRFSFHIFNNEDDVDRVVTLAAAWAKAG